MLFVVYNIFFSLEKQREEYNNATPIHFMELPKLLVKWRERLVSPWEDALVRWLFLLEGIGNAEIFMTLEEIAMKDPVLNQAMEEWEKISEDPKVREYFARRKAVCS